MEKTVLYARGANGMYHSVPAEKLTEFQKQQKQLEESGEAQRILDEMNERCKREFGQSE